MGEIIHLPDDFLRESQKRKERPIVKALKELIGNLRQRLNDVKRERSKAQPKIIYLEDYKKQPKKKLHKDNDRLLTTDHNQIKAINSQVRSLLDALKIFGSVGGEVPSLKEIKEKIGKYSPEVVQLINEVSELMKEVVVHEIEAALLEQESNNRENQKKSWVQERPVLLNLFKYLSVEDQTEITKKYPEFQKQYSKLFGL